MREYVGLGVALALTWLLLSNHWEPLLLSLGAISVATVIYLVWRMRLLDEEGNVPRQVRVVALAAYCLWLSLEIVKANLHVAARVLSPRMRIEPSLVTVPAEQVTALGKVIYANSITLTPGTISMDVDEEAGTILVHALTEASARDVQSGAMGRRVRSVERA